MTPLRHVLALDNDAPICAPCTAALGGTHETAIPIFARVCGLCGGIRLCAAVGALTWPSSLVRPDLYGPTQRNAPGAPVAAVSSDPSQGSHPGEP
jgi:hypothetical protein